MRHSRLREDYSTQLMAIVRNGKTIITPDPGERFLPGDLLILFGPSDKLALLEEQLCRRSEG
ncbi:hypothetical protein GFC01_03150 [Desulfofundulus thermobenzoicus]|uniref:RCK C-terminal domain-containing protein n=1 Tax=Desulfofundulus thermobenzoicus TaxID=29376 RepID=A0A6N7IMW6_9FIRM|nr:TrkA C-terminal domain-containing protein [Desulfofundulus thermobenzoicus]MQL51274.1 hypothetical protein [Desulfofundulus thermobenzoicus]HHW44375.1 hypothetical protein [Desulfotomaculum sp.]